MIVRVVLLSLLLAVACEEPRPATGESGVSLSDLSVEGQEGTVAGSFAGVPFEAADVYFRSVQRAGTQRVDLYFADEVVDDCGLPLVRSGRRAFLRFDDIAALPRDQPFSVERGTPGDVSLHYETRIDGRWVGVGDGVAKVVFDIVTDARATGRIHACFDDGAESCIAGSFEARACLSRLDGFLPREGTGVADPPPAPRPGPEQDPEPPTEAEAVPNAEPDPEAPP